MKRFFVAVLAALAGILLAGSPAWAQSYLDEAAAELQAPGDNVFISPTADGITPGAESRLAAKLRPDDYLVIAALPAEAGLETSGDNHRFAQQLGDRLGRPQLILVVGIGSDIQVVTNLDIPRSDLLELIKDARSDATSQEDAFQRFIAGWHSYQADTAVKAKAGSYLPYVLVGLTLALVGGLVFWLRYRRRRTQADVEQLVSVIEGRAPGIDDAGLREALQSACAGTRRLFVRVNDTGYGLDRKTKQQYVDKFYSYLVKVQTVLAQYLEVQDHPSEWPNRQQLLDERRDAMLAYYTGVEDSHQRVSEGQIPTFTVKTMDLLASRLDI